MLFSFLLQLAAYPSPYTPTLLLVDSSTLPPINVVLFDVSHPSHSALPTYHVGDSTLVLHYFQIRFHQTSLQPCLQSLCFHFLLLLVVVHMVVLLLSYQMEFNILALHLYYIIQFQYYWTNVAFQSNASYPLFFLTCLIILIFHILFFSLFEYYNLH